ncbi:MAG: carbonic anhydrase, partial [Syntrophomonadaceae bacterium]|nr:carbonic anhydrase [Syntrophomonadaceae bacterium]
MTHHGPSALSAAEARARLEEGNARFTSARPAPRELGEARRHELAEHGQHPFAVVITCSDSRVPPELIFDQALGDIFVVRVAGNVLDEVAMGSVEYGAEHLGVPLVVVLGHEKCGAVKATVDGGEAPGSIGAIVERIRPAADRARATGATGEELYEKTTDENIRQVVAAVCASPVIRHLQEHGALSVLGAKYWLSSG